MIRFRGDHGEPGEKGIAGVGVQKTGPQGEAGLTGYPGDFGMPGKFYHLKKLN